MASREDRWLHPLRGAWAGQFNTADGEEKKKKKKNEPCLVLERNLFPFW